MHKPRPLPYNCSVQDMPYKANKPVTSSGSLHYRSGIALSTGKVITGPLNAFDPLNASVEWSSILGAHSPFAFLPPARSVHFRTTCQNMCVCLIWHFIDPNFRNSFSRLFGHCTSSRTVDSVRLRMLGLNDWSSIVQEFTSEFTPCRWRFFSLGFQIFSSKYFKYFSYRFSFSLPCQSLACFVCFFMCLCFLSFK